MIDGITTLQIEGFDGTVKRSITRMDCMWQV